MQKKKYFTFLLIFFLVLVIPSYAVLEIPNTQPKVGAEQWKKVLDKTWNGLKKRNIDPYGTGLIHRPKSETPGDAVSEGVGYGMILALYANDQKTFNRIWDASEQYMFNNNAKIYDWRVNQSGTLIGHGPATDADEDIALMLIFADKLVQKGLWENYTSSKYNVTYAQRAQDILNAIWSIMIQDGRFVKPGDWGGSGLLNAGYFSPASYRIFKDFDNNKDSHHWDNVIEQCYQTLKANNTLYEKGMIPDWSDAYGNFLSNGPGYNAYLKGKSFFKDAIRILWRISLDAIWFDEPKAKEFLTNSLNFINSKGGASASNYYQLEGSLLGELLPKEDIWKEFNDEKNEETWRYRREHSHLTIGMWSTAAMAVGTDEDKIDFSRQMAKFYEYDEDADFFGLILDTVSLEDTLHNEMYFDQFLAWFGVSLMSGTFSNIIDDLENPKENIKGIDFNPFVSIPKKLASNMKNQISLLYGSEFIQFIAPSHWSKTLWQVYDLNGTEILRSVGKNQYSFKSRDHKGIFIIKASSEKGIAIRKLQIQ